MGHLVIPQPFTSRSITVFATSIVYLRRELNVPSARIAEAFGTSESNVNTIRSRGSGVLGDPGLDLLLRPEASRGSPSFAARYGIRRRIPHKPASGGSRNLERTEAEFDRIVTAHRADYDFLAGARALRGMRERIGYPQRWGFLRLVARIHAMRSWFFSHSGFGASSLREAALGVPLLDYLYARSGDSSLLREIRSCYVAASNASLLRRHPATARLLLEKARQVSESLGSGPDWEWIRQQGTACFQSGDPDEARRLYRLTAEMAEPGDAPSNGFPGRRHLSLLQRVDWDEAVSDLDCTERRMGRHSLEYSVQLNWTAAAGIASDDAVLNRRALEMAGQAPVELFASLGHQATVSHLLRLTGLLNLPPSSRTPWMRFLMYENAFRDC
jgi:hypothetical protein